MKIEFPSDNSHVEGDCDVKRDAKERNSHSKHASSEIFHHNHEASLFNDYVHL